jgi:acyl-CoA thioesterase FadM
MNLVFRLAKVLLLFFFRGPRRAPLLGELRLRFRVWPNDLDTNGHMNNGRYLTLLDLGRLDLLLRMGAVGPALRNKWYPVLAACQVRFRKPLNLFQEFEIVTRIAGWDEKWIYIDQKMMRGGRTVMHAFLKGVFTGGKGSVPITSLLKEMGNTEVSPPLPPAFSAWLAAERLMAEGGAGD